MKINTENKNLVRDTNSMALLNVNERSLTKDSQYKQKLQKENESKALVEEIQAEVKEIKQNISKILEMLNRGS
jgi:hypothetical protein